MKIHSLHLRHHIWSYSARQQCRHSFESHIHIIISGTTGSEAAPTKNIPTIETTKPIITIPETETENNPTMQRIPSWVHEHNTRVNNIPESEKKKIREKLKDSRIPLMARKFMAHDLNPIDPARFAPKPYVEKYYFFYGTLMDPSMLTRVLDLDHKPDLRPAYILDHKMKVWGPYPAVLDEVAIGQRIDGMAFKVKSEEDEKKLAAYGTGMYRGKGVMVHFGGGGREKERVVGCMFVWNADEAVLREGRFDMGGWLEWERRMGE